MALSFSTKWSVLCIVSAFVLGVAGCAESHLRDGGADSDGAIPFGDGSVIRDGGIRRDATTGIDATVGIDAGPVRTWAAACASVCQHLLECGSPDVDNLARCTRDCARTETSFTIPGCRELTFEAVNCIEGLGCGDIMGLAARETICAPIFARIERMCSDTPTPGEPPPTPR